MTEAEWVASSDLFLMLRACRHVLRRHPRKGRLFAVACCYRIWHLIGDQRSRAAVEAAAQYADGLVSKDQLKSAEAVAHAASVDAFRKKGEVAGNAEWAAFFAAGSFVDLAANRASNSAFVAAGDGPKPGPEHAAQCHLLRCIFGPLPFRPVNLNADRLSSTVTALAQTIYQERAFDRLPILADALEDAGCTSQDILSHCRQPGVHVRGCWALDLLLGKE